MASIGCGCYDRDGSITDALVAALDDCTDSVRQATVEAIAEGAQIEYCAAFQQRTCGSGGITNRPMAQR